MNKIEAKTLIQKKVGHRRINSGVPSYTKSERRLLETLVWRIRINVPAAKYREQQVEDTYCESPIKNLATAVDCSIERLKRFLSRFKKEGLVVESAGKNNPRYTVILEKVMAWPDVKKPWTQAERARRYRINQNKVRDAKIKELEQKIAELTSAKEAK